MQLIHNFCIWPKIQQKTPAKNPPKIHGKNLLKIPCDKNLLGSAKIFCENFNIKILNNTKNSLILPNKQKTFIMKNLMFKLDQTNLTLLPTIQYYPIMRTIKIVWLNFNLFYFIR